MEGNAFFSAEVLARIQRSCGLDKVPGTQPRISGTLHPAKPVCGARKASGDTQDGWTANVNAFSRAQRSERLAVLRHPRADIYPRYRVESGRWLFVPAR
jgi:hypothetical protein